MNTPVINGIYTGQKKHNKTLKEEGKNDLPSMEIISAIDECKLYGNNQCYR